MQFEPTRRQAEERLAQFVPKAGHDYAQARNFDVPGHASVSTLSPYIRHRILTEQEVIAAVLQHHSRRQAEKFIQEVFWRSYWKGWLELRPEVWRSYQGALGSLLNRVQTEAGFRAAFEQACLGQTEIDCFNAWAQELVYTGYLHNHTRMWFASIWIHTLRLPWQLGADFFLRHLLDGDPASNTLSWRWVAGLQTAGKTYLASASNIERFTKSRFRPAPGAFASEPVIVPPEPAYLPRPCPNGDSVPQTGKTGLLLHEDDLSPEHILAQGLQPDTTISVTCISDRSPLSMGALPHAFTQGAMEDAIARHHDQLGHIAQGDDAEPVARLAGWAREAGLDHVVTAYAPVGPVADLLDRLKPALEAQRIALHRIQRPFDGAAWPLAKAGFFKFNKSIPDLLNRLS